MAATLLVVSLTGPGSAHAGPDDPDGEVPDEVDEQVADDGEATFWVVLEDRAALDAAARAREWSARGEAVMRDLRRTAQGSQDAVLETARRHGADATPYWIANAVRVTGDEAALQALVDHDGVAEILPTRTYEIPDPVENEQPDAQPDDAAAAAAGSSVEWNVDMVRAPEVWSQYGTRGEGIVVGSLDTGVEATHPALRSSYRGYDPDGSADHDYHFFDPTGVCEGAAPCDNNGHGTHTTGTVVGDDPRDGKPHTGVAPGAQWIAAKGCATDTCADADLLAAAQWLLAPTDADGEHPRPELRPHIVNNSWGSGPSDFFFRETVRAWKAAGIMPVFSAGNDGPWCQSAGMPGGLRESYAVGAVDSAGTVAGFSSRGPSQDDQTKPDIAAPGVDINSSVPGDAYGEADGTSMAAPHVTGAVALLWSAAESLRRDSSGTRALLDSTAVDREDTSCGGTAADNNVYGEGLLDAKALLDTADVGPSGIVQGTVDSSDDRSLYDGAQLTFTGEHTSTVVTEPDGTFRLQLPPGTYQVEGGAFGHEPVAEGDIVVVDDETTRLDLTLPALAHHELSGVVSDEDGGESLAGASVALADTPIAGKQTDADGAFRFPAVPEGDWQLTTEYGRCADAGNRSVTLSEDTELTVALERRRDSYGYTCRLAGFDWIEGTQDVSDRSFRDGSGPLVELPFAFPFYGRSYESLLPGHGTRAAVGFADPINVAVPFDTRLPAPEIPNAMIFGFNQTDGNQRYNSEVFTTTVGQAPDRTFVVEWRFSAYAGAGEWVPTHDTELLLHEDGRIGLQYRDVSSLDPTQNGALTNVAMQGEDGQYGFEYSYEEPVLSDGLAIEFDPGRRSFVRGTVTDANDGEPIDGARVRFPMPGGDEASVHTGEDGRYRISLPEGEWDVTAEGVDYRASTRSVTSSGERDSQRLDFALETGRIAADTEPVQVELPQGGHHEITVDLANAGSAPLTATVAESGRSNQPARRHLRDPESGARVLLLQSGNESWRSPYAQQALDSLGVSYHVAAFREMERVFWALGERVYDYDLIVAEETGKGYSYSTHVLQDWVAQGGRLIFQQDGPTWTPLWNDLGVEVVDDGDVAPVHWWDRGHGMFHQVQDVPALTERPGTRWLENGDDVRLSVRDGEAVAGYTADSEEDRASIVVGNDGRTIAKGFVDCKAFYTDPCEGFDRDEDGVADEVELWQNMIDGLLDGYYRDLGWLDAGLAGGDAGPADPGSPEVSLDPGEDGSLTIGVDATELAVGEHTGYVSVHSDDGRTPYAEVPVRVTVTEGPATVTIRDVDTGLANRQLDDGRTIDEVIKDEATWPNRGSLVRHVGEIGRDLRGQGVITARERSELIRAAAQATM